MKILERNKTPFWYQLFDRTKTVEDEYGNEVGSAVVYKAAVEIKGNISSATGSAQVEQFGNFAGYDKLIVVDDMSCPIEETTVLFIDKKPEYDAEGNPLFDYVVKRVAKSLNVIAYAVKRVDVS